jgi:hypothetical protein
LNGLLQKEQIARYKRMAKIDQFDVTFTLLSYHKNAFSKSQLTEHFFVQN